jgi:hypothetical protein
LPLAINKTRGIEGPEKAWEVVSWLFHGKQPDVGLELSSRDEKGTDRSLSMYLEDGATARERFPEALKSLAEAFPGGEWHRVLGGLILRYEQSGEPPRFSWAAPNSFGGGMTWISARIPWKIPCIYLGSGMLSREQDVKLFGELEAAKRQAEIIPALKILDDRLQRLALVPLADEPELDFSGSISSSGPPLSFSPGQTAAPVSQAGETILHGDIKGLPRLIPRPLMGEGLRRVLSIVLAIANAPGGVVLIDEIENGLHYSVQKKVWQAIAQAARQADVQVFATTHSWECLRWAHEAFSESEEYDMRLFRLSRTDGSITVAGYDRERIESALYNAVEMR